MIGEEQEAYCRLDYSVQVLSRAGSSPRMHWLRVEAQAKMLRIVEATPDKDISPAFCTDDGHQTTKAGVLLHFVLWAGLYLAVGFCFTVRASPAHPLVPVLMQEGIYLPLHLAEPTTLARLLDAFRPPGRYTDESDPSGMLRRTQTLRAHRLAYVFALLFTPEIVERFATAATERVRGFITSSSYPDNTALYEAVAAVEAGHLGTVFSGDPANSPRSYFRGFFKRLGADERGEVLWPKNPLAWRVFFVKHYGAMVPGIARYFVPGTTS